MYWTFIGSSVPASDSHAPRFLFHDFIPPVPIQSTRHHLHSLVNAVTLLHFSPSRLTDYPCFRITRFVLPPLNPQPTKDILST